MENIFENLNTHENAWVFGAFCSDGHFFKNSHDQGGWKITSTDKDFIDKIVTITRYENKVNIRKAFGNNQTQYSIQKQRKDIFRSLIKLGFDNKKSQTLKFPNYIEDEFMGSFVRGFF